MALYMKCSGCEQRLRPKEFFQHLEAGISPCAEFVKEGRSSTDEKLRERMSLTPE